MTFQNGHNLKNQIRRSVISLALLATIGVAHADPSLRFIQVQAKDKTERSRAANTGMSIEAIRSDSVWGFANSKAIERLEKQGLKILGNFDQKVGRGGHQSLFDFPAGDAKFHNYSEMTRDLKELQKKYPQLVSTVSIGKTIENRDIWALHINSSMASLPTDGYSSKPGIVYMGNHHAREHVSAEIPLLFAQYLLEHQADSEIAQLLETRDIWIIPMVNPDGVEYDIAKGRYQMWRKNRRVHGDGNFGTDLNRNYGYQWGTGGSSDDTSSEVYMGTEPFSEPETQHIRDFVNSHLNIKILLSFHTFSELILYPWGNTYDPISNSKDFETYKKMATTMASWNHYTPQQSSDLYIASGDTTDWSYGVHGIFSFTFELSPKDMWSGGFYPGAKIIDQVFKDNLQPCLYLLKYSSNPYQSLEDSSDENWLKNYVQP